MENEIKCASSKTQKVWKNQTVDKKKLKWLKMTKDNRGRPFRFLVGCLSPIFSPCSIVWPQILGINRYSLTRWKNRDLVKQLIWWDRVFWICLPVFYPPILKPTHFFSVPFRLEFFALCVVCSFGLQSNCGHCWLDSINTGWDFVRTRSPLLLCSTVYDFIAVFWNVWCTVSVRVNWLKRKVENVSGFERVCFRKQWR